MSGLPAGWVGLPFGETVQIQKGKKPFDLGGRNTLRTIPYINIAAFEKKGIAEYAPIQNVPSCNETDTLLVWDGARAGLAGRGLAGYIGSTLTRINSDLITPELLFYFVSSKYDELNSRTKGVGIPHIDPTVFNGLKFALPPAAEQTRIVAKLDALLSELDAGVAQLKAAQKKLVQYRQSLLKAAVEGTLTADWRAQQKTVRPEPVEGQLIAGGSTRSPRTDLYGETGGQFLERILTDRRSRWQAKQLAKYTAQGKPPPKDWQSKYPEPVQPDTTDLPALPQGWVWASVDCLLSDIETGKSFKCDERPPRASEIGVVKVSAVSWGEYDEQESKTCTVEDNINPDLFVKTGDFLFSRANTVELVGACVIAQSVLLNVMLSDKILRLVLVQDDLKPWLLYLLRSQVGRLQIEMLASGNQESMKNIGQERIRSIAIPIGPHLEIIEAMHLAEEGFSQADLLRNNFEIALKQSAAQRKNILKAAFAGKLVPQDPSDEPASALLARIKTDRDAQREHSSKSTRKSPRLMRGKAVK